MVRFKSLFNHHCMICVVQKKVTYSNVLQIKISFIRFYIFSNTLNSSFPKNFQEIVRNKTVLHPFFEHVHQVNQLNITLCIYNAKEYTVQGSFYLLQPEQHNPPYLNVTAAQEVILSHKQILHQAHYSCHIFVSLTFCYHSFCKSLLITCLP